MDLCSAQGKRLSLIFLHPISFSVKVLRGHRAAYKGWLYGVRVVYSLSTRQLHIAVQEEMSILSDTLSVMNIMASGATLAILIGWFLPNEWIRASLSRGDGKVATVVISVTVTQCL